MSISLPLINWTDHVERADVFEVHVALTTAVLETLRPRPLSELHLAECQRMLDESLWAVTEIRPTPRFKGDQRYISEGVKALFVEYSTITARGRQWCYAGPRRQWHGRRDPRRCLKHEHVIPRRFLRRELLAAAGKPLAIKAVLASSLCCLVTHDEDARLTSADRGISAKPAGWARYQAAKIRVWDRTAGSWLL